MEVKDGKEGTGLGEMDKEQGHGRKGWKRKTEDMDRGEEWRAEMVKDKEQRWRRESDEGLR